MSEADGGLCYLKLVNLTKFLKLKFKLFLIVVSPCILTSINYLHQRMHYLLKRKILQFVFKYFLYIAPTCFGPIGPSSGSTYQNLAEVTKISFFKIKR
jgi:hypothetical protein